MNLTNIPPAEQEAALSSFWTMLQECERTANGNGDPVLRHWVEQWYEQWNRITDDTELDLPMLALNAAARVDRLSAELAASNERIRELETDLRGALLQERAECARADVEREVSDKLEKALKFALKHIDPKAIDMLKWSSGKQPWHVNSIISAALAEVAAIRKKESP